MKKLSRMKQSNFREAQKGGGGLCSELGPFRCLAGGLFGVFQSSLVPNMVLKNYLHYL
jgi:hypothetical protein